MTRVIASDMRLPLLSIICALVVIGMTIALPSTAFPASLHEEGTPFGDEKTPVPGGERDERVVVAPEPPPWRGWSAWRPGMHRSAPRIMLWVDRGEWSTYRPGDRLWVYFRVDRPCYVTILDYAPDGRVDTIFPSRWSGSSFVSPGVTYRIPESRRYSLRIAGPGGIETLVACAHETPWPSGPHGVWIPRHRPDRGSVVVGRPGGSPPPGWRGRIEIHPDRWPVPPAWREWPERWSCDAVSFYVDAGGPWYEGPWHGGPWGSVHPGSATGEAPWPGGSWNGCPYGGWEGWYDDETGRSGYGGAGDAFRDVFRMTSLRDHFYREICVAGERAVISVECVESSRGLPTEIVGRLSTPDGRRDRLVFRLDVDGKHGQMPSVGQTFYGELDRLAVEISVVGVAIDDSRPGRESLIKSIDLDIRAHAR